MDTLGVIEPNNAISISGTAGIGGKASTSLSFVKSRSRDNHLSIVDLRTVDQFWRFPCGCLLDRFIRRSVFLMVPRLIETNFEIRGAILRDAVTISQRPIPICCQSVVFVFTAKGGAKAMHVLR